MRIAPFDKASVEREAHEQIEAARRTWPSDMRWSKYDKTAHANLRRYGKEIRARRRGVLGRLRHGPWPTRYPQGLADCRGSLAQDTSERTMRFLEDEGRVERFTDESGTENWRITQEGGPSGQ